MKKLFILSFLSMIAFTFLSANDLGAQPDNPDQGEVDRLSFYKDNYFITGYSTEIDGTRDGDNQVKFQVSFKFLLDLDFWGWLESDIFNLYFIFTQKHFWNLYDASAPFQDINFSPALMLNFNTGLPFFYKVDLIPILHESNGQDGTLDRSWNRLIVNVGLLKFQYFALDASGWYIYPFNKSDNNDNIHRYSGYFEICAKFSDNLDDPIVQVDYHIRVWNRRWTQIMNIKFAALSLLSDSFDNDTVLFIQLYHGYLEGLAHYDERTSRIRVGLGFTP